MPAQSSRSIGFLMLVGSSLTLCGLIYNNNAMLLTWFVDLPHLTLTGHHKGPRCPFDIRLFLSWR